MSVVLLHLAAINVVHFEVYYWQMVQSDISRVNPENKTNLRLRIQMHHQAGNVSIWYGFNYLVVNKFKDNDCYSSWQQNISSAQMK